MTLIEILDIATKVVTAASAVAAVTPTTKDDGILAKLKYIINFFALNVLNAKPAAPVKK